MPRGHVLPRGSPRTFTVTGGALLAEEGAAFLESSVAVSGGVVLPARRGRTVTLSGGPLRRPCWPKIRGVPLKKFDGDAPSRCPAGYAAVRAARPFLRPLNAAAPRPLDLLEALERNAPLTSTGGDATWRRPRRGGLLSARVGGNKTRAPGYYSIGPSTNRGQLAKTRISIFGGRGPMRRERATTAFRALEHLAPRAASGRRKGLDNARGARARARRATTVP